jgi:hypothetical protein
MIVLVAWTSANEARLFDCTGDDVEPRSSGFVRKRCGGLEHRVNVLQRVILTLV